MPKKITTQDYIERCKERGLDLPLEDYANSKIKIKHKCNKGHIYLQNPSNHLNGRGCPICGKRLAILNRSGKTKKKTPQEYYNECKERRLDLPIEDYVNANTKIEHKCNKGHIYLQNPHKHLQGRGCPYCARNVKKTAKQYYEECKEKNLDLPIEDYQGNKINIKHKCSKGHIYLQTPSDHLQDSGCPYCARNINKTPKQYYEECKDLGYDLPIEDYVNARVKIKHKCKYDHIYKQIPYSHLEGYGCPICNESHGEKIIRNYLSANNIEYISQKTFKDLKDKKPLSYDFYLPKYNILIEYQGIQHYKPKEYFGGEEQFKVQQLHDKMKREYAKANGYKLLELHYSLDTQEKVNTYLERRLKD